MEGGGWGRRKKGNMTYCIFLFLFQRKSQGKNFAQTRFKIYHIFRHFDIFNSKCLRINMTPPPATYQSNQPRRTNQTPRSSANGFFQNGGVCGQAFPPFPSPTPLLPLFLSSPHFSRVPNAKTPSRGPAGTGMLATQAILDEKHVSSQMKTWWCFIWCFIGYQDSST